MIKLREEMEDLHSLWLKTNGEQGARIDFTKGNLTDAIFEKCNLDNVSFKNSILQSANFTRADLKYSMFSKVDLTMAHFIVTNFYLANFTGSIFTQACFDRTTFQKANLIGVDLSPAILTETDALKLIYPPAPRTPLLTPTKIRNRKKLS
jgi:uncharacterized protein YjbI with pentapeptide repeats